MSIWRRAAEPVRRALHASAAKYPRFRRLVEIAARESDRALRDDWYDSSYFSSTHRARRGEALAGYDNYTRDASNADVAAYVIWRYLPVTQSLDVGCATGFVVEALRELGVDARGVDVSQYAIDNAALGARGHISYGNLRYKLPFKRGQFDVVSALETLEHLPPDLVPHAVRELRRVTRSYLVATIPSFGPNPFGPGGWLDTKVSDESIDRYRALGDGFDGPIAYDDLLRDDSGQPIEGHLTIASFAWWTAQFQAAGFARVPELEARIHSQLARFGLTKYWNLYVLAVPGTPLPSVDLRTTEAIERVERDWKLSQRRAQPDDVQRVRESLGDDVFDGVPLNLAD